MSLDICETVLIVGEKSKENPTGVTLINKSDYVEGMELAEGQAPVVSPEPVAPVAPVTPEVTTFQQGVAQDVPWAAKT